MTDSNEAQSAAVFPQKLAQVFNRAVVTQFDGVTPRFLANNRAVGLFGDETRGRVKALDLAAQCQVESTVSLDEDREFDAGGTSVEDQDGIYHKSSGAFGGCAPVVGNEFHNCNGRQPCANRVRAAGENDRHARTVDDSGGIGSREVLQLFREHIAGFEVGDQEDVGFSGDG
jgi:hypothetical protein